MSAVHPFSLERPTSVDAAVAILATAPDDARVMAGGQSLTPLLTLGLSSPEIVVSLDRCADLNEIETNEAALHLGAMVTTAEVERSKHIAGIAPLLTTAAREVGSIHVRNFGTAVGNVCHADPGSDLIPALLCHHGAVQLRSPAGVRSVDIADFVTGPFSTAIAGAEIATSITISREDTDGWHHGYRKLVKRSGDLAIATCAVRLRLESGAIQSARIAIGGALSKARRLHAVEDALSGCAIDAASECALSSDWSVDATEYLMEDEQVSLEYLHLMFPRFIAATVADALTGGLA